MKKAKKYKAVPKESVVKELAATYGKPAENELVFFSSFNEMNESDVKGMGKLTATERFQHITFTLQNLYAEELKRKVTDKSLHFE